MKLDDTGVAFFVELVKDGDYDESFTADLATSPIPDNSWLGYLEKVDKGSENIPDKYISREAQTEVIKEAIRIESRIGKHKSGRRTST